eukprot:7385374-Prymnesium_polylepis.1
MLPSALGMPVHMCTAERAGTGSWAHSEGSTAHRRAAGRPSILVFCQMTATKMSTSSKSQREVGQNMLRGHVTDGRAAFRVPHAAQPNATSIRLNSAPLEEHTRQTGPTDARDRYIQSRSGEGLGAARALCRGRRGQPSCRASTQSDADPRRDSVRASSPTPMAQRPVHTRHEGGKGAWRDEATYAGEHTEYWRRARGISKEGEVRSVERTAHRAAHRAQREIPRPGRTRFASSRSVVAWSLGGGTACPIFHTQMIDASTRIAEENMSTTRLACDPSPAECRSGLASSRSQVDAPRP